MSFHFDYNNILRELANDDKSAFKKLFDYYYPRLYRFSKSFLKIEDGIDDILQEVFVKIWQNRKNIDTSSSFNAFIFTITKNALLNELRKSLRDQKNRDIILKESIAEEYESFEKVEYIELKEKVDVIIESLPLKHKEIFKLSRVEGLSHKEIAEKLNISTKTVEYHISQSIKVLKSELKSFGLISILYLYFFL